MRQFILETCRRGSLVTRVPRASRAFRTLKWPLAAVTVTGAVLHAQPADAQLATSNVPLPNVLLLLDTSGSFEEMINGSQPEDAANNPVSPGGPYADCTNGLSASLTSGTGLTAPNRWGVLLQALTGNIQPYYSCINENRTTAAFKNQYGIRMGATDATLAAPDDYGYYLPYHRPASIGSPTANPASMCVYTPYALPGAPSGGGVGSITLQGIPSGSTSRGATGTTDCNGGACAATDFPADAIETFLYDGASISIPGIGAPGRYLTTAQYGYGTSVTTNATTTACTFQQDNQGILTAEGGLLRFALMTFDNDTDPGTGVQGSPTVVTNTPTFHTETPSPVGGQWSYFPSWNLWTPYSAAVPPGLFDTGLPFGCTTGAVPFEVGARNPAAPPWEGRLIGFPGAGADSTATIQNNQLIQTAIRAIRPYGATPTAGLLSDAEYYLWQDPTGPGKTDDFIQGGCRQQNIILLTDGAPNLDLRVGAGCTEGGGCPYALPEATAAALYTGIDSNASSPLNGKSSGWASNPPAPWSRTTAGAQVLTYVIGFAVSDVTTGLPVNCQNLAETGALVSMCGAPSLPGTNPGSGASAATDYNSPCCSLQRIAVAGGTQRAYFADTPGDLNAALAAVIGQIAGQVASQTLPSYSPNVTYAAGTNAGTSLSFYSSFDGQAVPWTGDVQRQQDVCGFVTAGCTASACPEPVGATPPPASSPRTSCPGGTGNGDDFGCDLQAQSISSARNFLAFSASNASFADTASAGAYSIRPYLATAANQLNPGASIDGLGTFGASGGSSEIWASGAGALNTMTTWFPSNVLGIQPGACQDPLPNSTPPYAVLSSSDCAQVALSFTLAMPSVSTPSDPIFASSVYNSPGTSGVPGLNRNAAPMGAILHSTPLVDGPPAALVRDDSYQTFSKSLSPPSFVGNAAGARDTMLYVATTDGMLHAFDTSYSPHGTLPGAEAWSFMPPGVTTGLIGNYPAANKVLLDGAPKVKDVVFTRSLTEAGGGAAHWPEDWHTMLVAGYGAGGRGYYALDVTDPRAGTHTAGTLNSFSTYPTTRTNLTGPHFQWQLTSVNPPPGVVPTARTSGTVTELFGSTSGTPAITTVYIKPLPGGPTEEVGVAILPGGSNGVPVQGTCARELVSGTSGTSGYSYTSGSTPLVDPNFGVRTSVRQWGSGGCTGHNSNVPGRNLTIVSVATGEVIALFARPIQAPATCLADPTACDVPTDSTGNSIVHHLIATPFDSPITGTPVVYPSEVGSIAQHIYVGDADGTLWRIDVTNPDPTQWSAAIMVDAFYGAGSTGDISGVATYGGASTSWTSGLTPTANRAYDSQPISIQPVIALDQQGTVTVAFATGDQSALTTTYTVPGTTLTNPVTNFVYSVADTVGVPYAGATSATSTVRWYIPYINGERVTGPMAIFNNALYYATYLPAGNVAGTCSNLAVPSLWGLDFVHPETAASCPAAAGLGCGGKPLDYLVAGSPCAASSNVVRGQCAAPLDSNNVASYGEVIPGVTVAIAPSCATVAAPGADGYTGGSHTSTTGGSTGTTYSLVAQVKGTNHSSGAVNTITTNLKTPNSATIVDSWAAVVE